MSTTPRKPSVKSRFVEWFTAQHGPRLREPLKHLSDEELKHVITNGQIAAEVLRARKLYDEKETSALYAWTAATNKDYVPSKTKGGR
jgi:hypothetical protein